MAILLSKIDESTLLTALKQTQLIGHGQPLVYAQTHLELRQQVDPDLLIPTQRYVLKQIVGTLENIYHQLLKQGVDIFALTGAITFQTGQSSVPLTPPIIEESVEADGRKVLLISDGMHRVYTARKLKKRINVVLVSNVPKEYPYYAYPLQQGWQEVEELETLRKDFQKKTYREEDYKALFRNYNALFPGIQEKRVAL